jgi:hypothetical protein
MIDFSESHRLDRLFRGKTVAHWKLPPLQAIELTNDDEVLASIGGRAIWWARPGRVHASHVVEFPIPVLAESELPLDYLNGYHFMQLMPLLHFLREVTTNCVNWTAPSPRACITFDDPNLHAPSYGFFVYDEIARHAKRHNYQIAVATVPLDAWYSDRRAVDVLKRNDTVLSLLIHGNNHTRSEFAQSLPMEQRFAVTADCLLRIERLERSTGLSVERVLVPPHEALSIDMACAAMQMGIEGLSLSLASLRKWNTGVKWPSTLGILPAELLHNGCPILGRYPLNHALRGPALISTYLGRPIILVGHHADLADGLEILEHAAAEIGSVHGMSWGGLGSILRSNYIHKRDDDLLRVMPFSANVSVDVAEGVRYIEVEAPPGMAVDHSTWVVRRNGARDIHTVGPGTRFQIADEELVNISASALGCLNPLTFSGVSAVPLRALARRFACEFRDRLAPLRTRNLPR